MYTYPYKGTIRMSGGLVPPDVEYCISSVHGEVRMKQCSRKATTIGEVSLYQGMGQVSQTFGFCKQHSKAENVRIIEVQ